MSWVPISNCTGLSSIYTHDTLCHVSQNRVAAPHTLPFPLHHSRRQSWHPFGVSSISSLQPEQVLIWWKCIWLEVQRFLHILFLISERNPKLLILPYTFQCYLLQHAWSCRSIWKLQLTSLLVLGNIPNIILHDRLIFFDHSILPFFVFCRFFITGRFFINEIT